MLPTCEFVGEPVGGEGETDHLYISNVEVKNTWRYTSIDPYMSSWHADG
jgi:hypothetical protein